MQELDKTDEGRVPRTIEIELTRDLVESCKAGDVVTVLGMVKVMNAEQDGGTLQLDAMFAQHPLTLRISTPGQLGLLIKP